jgi:NADPH2:quinone reductase
VVDSEVDGLKNAVKAIAGESGVEVVLDPLGGEWTNAAFRTLGWQGRHLVVGFAGGPIPSLPSNLAIVKGASLVGVDLRQAGEREPAVVRSVREEVMRGYAERAFQPRLQQVLPVSRFDEAVRLAQARDTIGRIVVRWHGDAA